MMDPDAMEHTSSLATDAGWASLPRGADAAPVLSSWPGIEFGAYLRELCADAAGTLGSENGVAITCTAAEALLPTATAIRLGLIAEELIKNALEHAFPDGRGGRVAIAFAVDDGAWRLTVEDSGVGRAAASSRRGGLRLVRDLAGEVGGRLRIARLVGGTRCTVVGPQPRAGAFATALREDEVRRYLELTRPLEFTHRPGDEADAVAKPNGAVRRRLAASIALGWLSVEEALDETPPDPSAGRRPDQARGDIHRRPAKPQGRAP